VRKKLRWSDLSQVQKALIVTGAAAELVLTAAALRDLNRREPHRVRGSRLLWVLSFVVQPFGPLAYFAVGRTAQDG
jgi:hypothetical protein